MNNFHNVNTEGWLEFPFSVDGHNFVSKVSPTYALLPLIQNLGADGFADMNKKGVKELGILADTFEEMASRLWFINKNASECVIELVVA
jgi:hypothetical protein